MAFERRALPVLRKTLSVLLVPIAAGVTAGVMPGSAAAVSRLHYTGTRTVWPGVVFRTFQTSGSRGPVRGNLLDVDLRDPHVTVGLLHPPVVAARQPVSLMAATQHAVAGVNGDFFHISESHAGVPATGSAVGPEMVNGHALKGAVPDGQRFGPFPPAGATTEEVLGVGGDRVGRVTTLHLTGTVGVHGPLAPPAPTGPPASTGPPAPAGPAEPVRPPVPFPPSEPVPPSDSFGIFAPGGYLDEESSLRKAPRPPGMQRVRTGHLGIPLRGLNQYALPVGGVGAFTSAWGSVSRRRAVCGTDAARRDPCAADAAEVTVRHGAVTQVGDAIGAGAIPPDTTVLVGREAGADVLRRLRPGDHVRLGYRLAGPGHLHFAVGGFAILRNGAPPPGLNVTAAAARTAAGVSANGRHLYLVVVDGRSAVSRGLTLAELSVLLHRAGAREAIDLDGGGSSTFVLRAPGEPVVSVRNVPSSGAERAVANGVGVFVRP
jgi:hypothetical protein